jgi:hypothetical protein
LSNLDIINIEALEGVTVINVSDFMQGDDLQTSSDSKFFAMKGAALLYTTFDEVLLLDADNIPAKDPSFLFETASFRETGALFWKDFWMTQSSNPIYKILELDCVTEHQFESGQIVIKKSFPGVHQALSLAFYMQRNYDLYFNLFHGDKDSFRFSWRFFDVPYHQVRKN